METIYSYIKHTSPPLPTHQQWKQTVHFYTKHTCFHPQNTAITKQQQKKVHIYVGKYPGTCDSLLNKPPIQQQQNNLHIPLLNKSPPSLHSNNNIQLAHSFIKFNFIKQIPSLPTQQQRIKNKTIYKFVVFKRFRFILRLFQRQRQQ